MSIGWIGRRRPGHPVRRRRVLFAAVAAVAVAAAVLVLAATAGVAVRRHLGELRLRQLYPFCYRDQIVASSRANGLDPLLVAAVIRAESNYWTWAASRKGAMGLMQITPSTARWIAAQRGQADFDERMLYDPATNIAMGCWYLRHLLDQFHGNLPAALAAWNGGRTNVTGWLTAGHWSGTAGDLADIPFGETRTFVGRVLSYLAWYQQLYAEVGG
jgi:soluble lytic murein transglycosylase